MLALVVLAGALSCAPSPNACCQHDDECASGAVCFEGSCAASCTHESQCLEGELCLAGACVAPARSLAVCPFSFVDKRDPPRPSGDGGVPDAGEPREDGGRPVDDGGVPSCEDSFEPNDAQEDASTLMPGTYTARICPAGDHDWYRVVVPVGAIDLSVVVRFEHARGDLDVEILDESGHRLAVSQLTGDREEIRLPVHATGAERVLFVHVYGFGRAENLYTLELAFLPSTSVCVDDALEDNDTFEQATLLAPGSLLSAAFCAGDADVYRTPVRAGERVYSVLSYERGEELTLEVRSSTVEQRSFTLSGLELLAFRQPADADAYLRVGGTHVHLNARPYQVGLWTADGSCGQDAHEPNDLPTEAKVFPLQPADGFRAVQGQLCEKDVDVWRLSWLGDVSSLELSLEAPAGTRAFVVRADDLALLARLSPEQPATLRPGATVQTGRVFVVLLGAGEDESYQLRGRVLEAE